MQNHIRKRVLPSDNEKHEEQRQDLGFSVYRSELVQQRIEDESTAGFWKSTESGVVQYIGIAADEPTRIERHKKKNDVQMPLVEAGWTETMCREWCEQNDLLSPIYTTSARGGCWFCHNQGVDQLRQLRKNYPDLWALLMKWDLDSPVTFHADGRTVHDFDRRFEAEDSGYMALQERFKWSDLEEPQMNIFQFL